MHSSTVDGEGISRPAFRPLTHVFVWRDISLFSR